MTTTPIEPSLTLGSIVTAHPATAREMERLGLDYCCGGRRTLAAACGDQGLDIGEVTATLTEADRAAGAVDTSWADLGPVAMVDHLEATHHGYLKRELPRLTALAEKVEGAHGARHHELTDVRALVAELRADLEPHLMKEERILFPMIRQLFTTGESPRVGCGSVRNPILVMLAEHDRAGELLEQLREVTADYEVPADGCASYRALYAGLAELTADTHLHVHKENNLLFPAVMEREADRTG